MTKNINSEKVSALKTPKSIVVKVNSNKIALSKELLKAASKLKKEEGRFLVDRYYQLQAVRIKSEAQLRALYKGEEWDDHLKEILKNPPTILEWTHSVNAQLEHQIKRALSKFNDNNFMGKWGKEQVGVGEVLSAGLLVHIDIEQADTVGHIWSYAGYDPTRVWGKKEKRPHNADLKKLCWKLGESFVKVKGNPADIYGKIYAKRKALEIKKNMQGDFAEQAKKDLPKYKAEKDTRVWYAGMVTAEAYKDFLKKRETNSSPSLKPATVGEGEGVYMLSPGHIHARAKRYAVKHFLSDWHEIAYRDHYKKERPFPFAVAQLGHAHVRRAALPKFETNDPYWEKVIEDAKTGGESVATSEITESSSLVATE
jgi:hypothetical protein